MPAESYLDTMLSDDQCNIILADCYQFLSNGMISSTLATGLTDPKTMRIID